MDQKILQDGMSEPCLDMLLNTLPDGSRRYNGRRMAVLMIEALRANYTFYDSYAGYLDVLQAIAVFANRGPMAYTKGSVDNAGRCLTEAGWREQKITMVAGILRDKEVDGILDVFDRVADRYILTEIDNPRTVTADMWPGYMEGRSTPYDVVRSPREAVAKALSEQKDDCVIVAGSLYLAGQVRGYLKECIKNKV